MPVKKKGQLLQRENELLANRKYRQKEVYQRPDGSFITTTKINIQNPEREYKRRDKLTPLSTTGKKLDIKSERDIQRKLDKAYFGRSLEGLSEKKLKELQAKIDTNLITQPAKEMKSFTSRDILKVVPKINTRQETKIETTGTSITDMIRYYLFGQN